MGIFRYKELLAELVKREIKAKYKQSILGYAWVLLVPLINLAVLTVVFSFFIRIPTGNIPYPIFLFTALVPWTFTANSILSATTDLIANRTLITKIYVPREVFPISAVISKVVDFALTFVILVGIMYLYGIFPNINFLWLPVVFGVQALLILGVSFILSALNVFFRDVENILGLLITVWMYLTPVLYPVDIVPSEYLRLVNLNPMSAIIGAYRNVLLYQKPPSTSTFLYAALFSFAIFFLGYFYFRRRSRYFADVI